jgi:hypothetical protein
MKSSRLGTPTHQYFPHPLAPVRPKVENLRPHYWLEAVGFFFFSSFSFLLLSRGMFDSLTAVKMRQQL